MRGWGSAGSLDCCACSTEGTSGGGGSCGTEPQDGVLVLVVLGARSSSTISTTCRAVSVSSGFLQLEK